MTLFALVSLALAVVAVAGWIATRHQISATSRMSVWNAGERWDAAGWFVRSGHGRIGAGAIGLGIRRHRS